MVENFVVNHIRRFFQETRESIRDINRKYAEPRLKPSRPVRAALLFLRAYLFLLVGLLAYKFYLTAMGK